MSHPFFERPILNSPYDIPSRHWELDDERQPTQAILDSRRPADFITPIPQPRRRAGAATQSELDLSHQQLSEGSQRYQPPPR